MLESLSSYAQFFFLKLATQKGNDLLLQKGKKNGGSPTSFWKEHAPKNTLNLKNRASLANKATVSVSPKILLTLTFCLFLDNA